MTMSISLCIISTPYQAMGVRRLCLWPYGYAYGPMDITMTPMSMTLCPWPYAYSIRRMRRQKHRLQRLGIKRPQMAYLALNSMFIVIVNINVTNYRAELNEDHIISLVNLSIFVQDLTYCRN